MALTTFLIVDGYNIIHAWPELEELTTVSLESARQKLMDKLCNYQGISGETVILVFDGYLVKGSVGSVLEYNNIYVVYTSLISKIRNILPGELNMKKKSF